MVVQFVRIAVDLPGTGIELRHRIETRLQDYGEPLRWAITSVQETTAQVEAVVTVLPPLCP
ncbi:MAG: hypothetical protein AAGI45_16915 [Cyanobacteria bacterium P01_H01_bin.26]